MAGLRYLWTNRGVLDLILFLAAINLTASVYNAALPAMLLSREGGGELALGLVNTCTGLANVAGAFWCHSAGRPKAESASSATRCYSPWVLKTCCSPSAGASPSGVWGPCWDGC